MFFLDCGIWFKKLILSLFVTTTLFSKEELPKPDEERIYKTVGDTELKLHLFLPENHRGTDEKPAIVFFFGGGWSKFNPTAIAADYRVKSLHGTPPKACVTDAKSALRWIREHADQLGIDPEKIIAGGGAAGAHIAAAAATTDQFNEKGEDLSVSCIERRSHSRENSENLPKKDAEPRCKVWFAPIQDQAHGFFNHHQKENYYKTVVEMDRFLESLGYLEGAPTLRKRDFIEWDLIFLNFWKAWFLRKKRILEISLREIAFWSFYP